MWRAGRPSIWLDWVRALESLPGDFIPVRMGNFAFSRLLEEGTGISVSGPLTGLLLAAAALPSPVRAELSYDYIEFAGIPYVASPIKLLGSTFKGDGLAGEGSYAFHDNWSVRIQAGNTRTDSGNEQSRVSTGSRPLSNS